MLRKSEGRGSAARLTRARKYIFESILCHFSFFPLSPGKGIGHRFLRLILVRN